MTYSIAKSSIYFRQKDHQKWLVISENWAGIPLSCKVREIITSSFYHINFVKLLGFQLKLFLKNKNLGIKTELWMMNLKSCLYETPPFPSLRQAPCEASAQWARPTARGQRLLSQCRCGLQLGILQHRSQPTVMLTKTGWTFFAWMTWHASKYAQRIQNIQGIKTGLFYE